MGMPLLSGGPSSLPYSLLSRLIVRLPRHALEDLAQFLIDRIDAIDGDPDFEDNNDREASDGDDTDVAWPEWDQRMPNDMKSDFERPTLAAGGVCHAMTEDDEEDDPSGQCDEDGINTALHVLAGRGAGCLLSDEDN